MDYPVQGILQARILEWVAFPFSRGIFPSQGSNPGLPHCRQILYQLSHKGSPNLDLREGNWIWTGDLLICNQMLYHWAILPIGIYLKHVSVATHLAVSSRINKENISKLLRGKQNFQEGNLQHPRVPQLPVALAFNFFSLLFLCNLYHSTARIHWFCPLSTPFSWLGPATDLLIQSLQLTSWIFHLSPP